MLLLCAGTEIRALCSRLGKSANLCIHVMVCAQLLQTGGCFVASGKVMLLNHLSYSNKVIHF